MAITGTRRGSATGTNAQTLPGEGGRRGPRQDAPQLPERIDQPGAQPSQGGLGASLAKLREQQGLQSILDAQGGAEGGEGTAGADPQAGMTKGEIRAAKRAAKKLKGTFEDYPHLLAIKPKEKYLFRSDYVEVDDKVMCVLGFFHDDGAQDNFAAFWGINRIPDSLEEGVTVVVLEQVRRMDDAWIDAHLKTTEKLDKLDEGEQAETGTASSRRRSRKIAGDMEVVSAEYAEGASYLHVHNRLVVRAPDLETLESTLDRIARLYIERFSTLKVAAYAGEQRRELSSVFGKNAKKRGRGFHYTSKELAGSHSLVTNGLNDATGEYVGYMVGDVNTSAVLLDVNAYQHHVVIADSAVNPVLNRAQVADMWGSKIAQAALLENARVVHLVLDSADLDVLGPKLERITRRLDMNSGDINMLEMFGEEADELSIFPAHLEKLVLMAEQAYPTNAEERSIIRGSLKDILNEFYVDKQMWYRNAKENRSRLRVVGIPHQHVPRLQDLVSYFDTRYKALSVSEAKDERLLNAYSTLRFIFKDLLDSNGSLFNAHTSDEIDGVHDARRVIYDFSRLQRRGKGIAMAQLVNTVGFAVDNLGLGDTVIVHGAENISDSVKEYLSTQFGRLFSVGGRVVYLYNDVDKMLADTAFNSFDAADWTVLGHMRDTTVADYQKKLGQDIPPDLERLVTQKGTSYGYLRRGVANVVFFVDLALGINPHRQHKRDAIERARASAGPGAASAAQEASTARALSSSDEALAPAPAPARASAPAQVEAPRMQRTRRLEGVGAQAQAPAGPAQPEPMRRSGNEPPRRTMDEWAGR